MLSAVLLGLPTSTLPGFDSSSIYNHDQAAPFHLARNNNTSNQGNNDDTTTTKNKGERVHLGGWGADMLSAVLLGLPPSTLPGFDSSSKAMLASLPAAPRANLSQPNT